MVNAIPGSRESYPTSLALSLQTLRQSILLLIMGEAHLKAVEMKEQRGGGGRMRREQSQLSSCISSHEWY